MDYSNKSSLQVQLCQQEIIETDVEIKNGISVIRESRGISDLQLNKLSQNVKENIQKMALLVDRMESFANTQAKKLNERDDILGHVKKHRDEIDLNIQNFRRVIFSSAQRIQKETRDALLEGSSSSVRQRISGAAKLRDESFKATESLSCLVSRMHEAVESSGDTLNTLVSSSEVINATDQEFSSMGATIQSSGRLLSKYSRRELTDKILITLAACLFFATAFYIVQKRLFAGRFSLW